MENIGGVYNAGQRVEVQLRENDDNSWAPATIGYYAFGANEDSGLVSFTVRFGDLITGLKMIRKPNEVFLDRNATINGTNTNIIPGSQIYTKDVTEYIIPVTLVSKNYLVNTHEGGAGIIPHTRIRRVVRTAQETAAQAQAVQARAAQAQARASEAQARAAQAQARASEVRESAAQARTAEVREAAAEARAAGAQARAAGAQARAIEQNGNIDNVEDDEDDEDVEDDEDDEDVEDVEDDEEEGGYAEGQPVEVFTNGVWRPGNVVDLVSYTVIYDRSGNLRMEPLIIEPENIRGLPWRIHTPVYFRQDNRWFRGLLTSINYSVNMENGPIIVASNLNIRRRRANGNAGRAAAIGIFERGQQVEVNVNDIWRPGEVIGLNNFTVRNTATGRNVNRDHTQVLPVTPLVGNRHFMPGDNVLIQEDRRLLPGTFVSRNYAVEIDNGLPESVPHTRMRLATQPRAAAAQPQIGRLLEEQIRISLEVHKAFQKLDFEKFMTIVIGYNEGASDFKNAVYPFQPLIDYIINDPRTTLDATEKTSLLRDLNGEIKRRLNEYLSSFPQKKDYVMEIIQFVMTQEPDYKDPYIRFLTFDCINAIGAGDPSCPKGVFEKAFLMNESVLKPLCSDDTTSASSTSTCKQVYRELLDCFYDHVDLEKRFFEWYEINNMEEGASPLANASEEARQEDFRTFVLSKAPRANPTAINEYIKKNKKIFETLMIGGRRKQKTLKKGKRKTLNKDKRKTSNKGKRKTLNKDKRKTSNKGKRKTKKTY